MSVPSPPVELDLHRLELRYASARLLEPRAVEQLARSIDKNGQLLACIAVATPGAEQWVLLDGYRRIAALRRLGRGIKSVGLKLGFPARNLWMASHLFFLFSVFAACSKCGDQPER